MSTISTVSAVSTVSTVTFFEILVCFWDLGDPSIFLRSKRSQYNLCYLETLNPWDLESLRLWDPELRPRGQDFGTLWLLDLETLRPWATGTLGPRDPKTLRLWDLETKRPWNLGALRSWHRSVSRAIWHLSATARDAHASKNVTQWVSDMVSYWAALLDS